MSQQKAGDPKIEHTADDLIRLCHERIIQPEVLR